MTAVVFFVAAVSVFSSPPPLWVPIALAAAYAGVVLWGVMSLSLQMFGDAVCSIPAAKGRLALTFDDGPDPHSTGLVLDLLQEAGAKATFFVVGNKVERHPEVLRRIVEEGHSLGIHTFDHNRLYAFLPPKVVQADIERTRAAVESACGQSPPWFRPPVGQMSPRTARGVELAECQTVGWNVRAFDGVRSATVEKCEARVRERLAAGNIVLMHDAWENQEVEPGETSEVTLSRCPAGVRALASILQECRRRELRPVTVEELILDPEI